MSIKIDVSVGEIMDKLTILDIKADKIDDTEKLANILKERESLLPAIALPAYQTDEIQQLAAELKQVNLRLWEIEDAIRLKEAEKLLDIKEAVVGENDSEIIATTRKSKTGFIESFNPKHIELWNVISNRLWAFVNAANRTNFAFDVSFLDSVQYTIYEDDGDHYDWHMDTFINTPNAYTRKLSLTLQLSDGSEYEGGNFELNDGTVEGEVRQAIEDVIREYEPRAQLIDVFVNQNIDQNQLTYD